MTEQPVRRRRRQMSDKAVAALPRKGKRYILSDPELKGMYVRVMPSGPHVYAAVARDPYGKQRWVTLGGADVFKIDEARALAREAIKRIRAGLDAIEPPPVQPDSVKAVAENWLRRHVEAKGIRTRPEIERCLTK